MRENAEETRRRTFDRELRDTLTVERELEMRRDVVIDELCDVWKRKRKGRRRNYKMNSDRNNNHYFTCQQLSLTRVTAELASDSSE